MIVNTTTNTATIIPTTFNTPHMVQKTVHSNYEGYLKVSWARLELSGQDKGLMGKATCHR